MKNFFILAGGYGARARPLSDFKPKPVFPVNQDPLISLILSQLSKSVFQKGFINIHHLPEMIKGRIKTEMEINFIGENVLTGNIVLKSVKNEIDDYLLVVNGDVFLEIPMTGLVEKVLQDHPDGVILIKEKLLSQYSTIYTDADRFLYRKKDNSGRGFFYTGVALLNKSIIGSIDEPNLFDVLAKRSFDVRVVVYDGIWCEFGSPFMYLNSVFAIKKHMGDQTRNSFAENVIVSKHSVLDNCVVWENSTLKNSQLKNCIVCNNVVLEDSRYTNKIITRQKIYDLC